MLKTQLSGVLSHLQYSDHHPVYCSSTYCYISTHCCYSSAAHISAYAKLNFAFRAAEQSLLAEHLVPKAQLLTRRLSARWPSSDSSPCFGRLHRHAYLQGRSGYSPAQRPDYTMCTGGTEGWLSNFTQLTWAHLRLPRPMSRASGSGGSSAAALAASSSACDSHSSASRQYAALVLGLLDNHPLISSP